MKAVQMVDTYATVKPMNIVQKYLISQTTQCDRSKKLVGLNK